MSTKTAIHFTCPTCGAEHERGFANGVDTFRCLGRGYSGHGFHPDPEIDCGVFLDVKEADEVNQRLGLPREWPWGDAGGGR